MAFLCSLLSCLLVGAVLFAHPAVAETERMRSEARCGEICRFGFCKADGSDTVLGLGPDLLLREKGNAYEPFVCQRVGDGNVTERVVARSSSQPSVYNASEMGSSPEPFTLVSEFMTTSRLPDDLFHLRAIRFPRIEQNAYTVARSTSPGGMQKAIDNLCVKLPITDYDVLDDKGGLRRRVQKSKEPDDCLSFRTVAPKLMFDLEWDSSDVFELTVEEPEGGELISKDNPSSQSGAVFRAGDLLPACAPKPALWQSGAGRATIYWPQNSVPPRGTFKLRVINQKNCGFGPTFWFMSTLIDGEYRPKNARYGRYATSILGGGNLVQEWSFNYNR